MCSCSCVRIHSLNKAKNYNTEACFELAAEKSSQTLWPVVPASAAGKLEKANINANKRDLQCIVISCFLMKQRPCQIVYTDTRARNHVPLLASFYHFFNQWFKMHVVKRAGYQSTTHTSRQRFQDDMLTHRLICPSTSQAEDRIKC